MYGEGLLWHVPVMQLTLYGSLEGERPSNALLPGTGAENLSLKLKTQGTGGTCAVWKAGTSYIASAFTNLI